MEIFVSGCKRLSSQNGEIFRHIDNSRRRKCVHVTEAEIFSAFSKVAYKVTAWFPFPSRSGYILCDCVLTGSRTPSACCVLGTGRSVHRTGKRPECEPHHSSHLLPRSKEHGSTPPRPLYTSTVSFLAMGSTWSTVVLQR